MIRVEGLERRFGAVRAIAGVGFEAADGRITGLLGPNGAGKSTTLRILYTVLRPDAGTAAIDGIDVVADPLGARRRIGVLPHGAGIYPQLTGRENIAYFARLHGLAGAALEARVDALIEELEISGYADRRAKGFSQGERIKVALARALVHAPKNLLLDEPTNGLDPAGRDDMLDLVRRIGNEFGISILMSSHLLTEIERVCDFLVVIEGGRLVRSDSLASFTGRTEVLTVEVDGPVAGLADYLRERGYEARAGTRELELDIRDDGAYDAIRDGTASLRLGLVRMEQGRRHLEDLFRDETDSEELAGV